MEKYLSAEDGGGSIVTANRDQAAEWETLTIIIHESGNIGLKTSRGLFLSADQGGGGKLYVTEVNWEVDNLHHFLRRR